VTIAEVKALIREFEQAAMKSMRLCRARSELPAGSTRARITTANARWARAAEERGRLAKLLGEAGIDTGIDTTKVTP